MSETLTNGYEKPETGDRGSSWFSDLEDNIERCDTVKGLVTKLGINITGTRASPTAIVAGTGIEFSGTYWNNYMFIQGSGGAVNITANPQITAATNVGQELILQARSDTNTVTLEDATGLSLNGTWVGEANRIIRLIWDGTNWVEMCRS